jgi:hypothetical protein
MPEIGSRQSAVSKSPALGPFRGRVDMVDLNRRKPLFEYRKDHFLGLR